MTANQIAYWNYVELKRANRAKERENTRSNKAREVETNRSNLANESISSRRQIEDARHNKASENETNRHNLIDESIRSAGNYITDRHNRAEENLKDQQIEFGWQQMASNIALEEFKNKTDMKYKQALADHYESQDATAFYNYDLNERNEAKKRQEEHRHNLKMESLYEDELPSKFGVNLQSGLNLLNIIKGFK